MIWKKTLQILCLNTVLIYAGDYNCYLLDNLKANCINDKINFIFHKND